MFYCSSQALYLPSFGFENPNHDIRGKPGEWEEDIAIWLKSQVGDLETTTTSGNSGNQHLHISSTVDGQPGSRHTQKAGQPEV